jgi:hypothetical protein
MTGSRSTEVQSIRLDQQASIEVTTLERIQLEDFEKPPEFNTERGAGLPGIILTDWTLCSCPCTRSADRNLVRLHPILVPGGRHVPELCMLLRMTEVLLADC